MAKAWVVRTLGTVPATSVTLSAKTNPSLLFVIPTVAMPTTRLPPRLRSSMSVLISSAVTVRHPPPSWHAVSPL